MPEVHSHIQSRSRSPRMKRARTSYSSLTTEEQFKVACAEVRELGFFNPNIPDDRKSKIHGLYRQAVDGDNTWKRPGSVTDGVIFEHKGFNMSLWQTIQAWEAWNSFRGKTPQWCWQEYVEEWKAIKTEYKLSPASMDVEVEADRHRGPLSMPNSTRLLPPSQMQDGVLYLDNNATTCVDPRVHRAMEPFLMDAFGNPSASYSFGARAKAAVEDARANISRCIGCEPSEIFFTSGATESDALAILGVAQGVRKPKEGRHHIITSLMEHAAVLEACRSLEQQGLADVTYIGGYTASGRTTREMVEREFTANTVLVSIMLANNEIGVVNDIEGIGQLCRNRDVLFHVDAAQGLGKVAFNVANMKVDLASFSAHKCHGPKGIGAIYIRSAVRQFVAPQMRGGGQEDGIRGGTHNVPGIVGFGEAARILLEQGDEEVAHCRHLRNHLLQQIHERLGDLESRGYRLIVNGCMEQRLPNNANMAFLGIGDPARFHAIIRKRLAISSGSACTAAKGTLSHVMACLGVPTELARTTVRCGVSRFTTLPDIVVAADVIVGAVRECFDASVAASLLTVSAGPSPTQRRDGLRLQTEPGPKPRLPAILGSTAMNVNKASSGALEIVGTIHNNHDIPRYIKFKDEVSEIRVKPEFQPALEGVNTYSHLWIVWLMNAVSDVELKHVPQGLVDRVPAVGIFACRCPQRPNHLAQSLVKVLEVTDETIVVRGLDAINGSEVVDIKPYKRQFDDPAVIFSDTPVVQPPWNDIITAASS